MDPNQFAQIIDQSGQVPMMVSEVRRRKALAVVLGQATVTDTAGNSVDLSDFVRPVGEEEAPAVEEEAAEAVADDAKTVAAANDDPAAVKF
jgi:trigger factor